MLRNLEDAISEGKLGGDAWWKERKKKRYCFDALKGKKRPNNGQQEKLTADCNIDRKFLQE